MRTRESYSEQSGCARRAGLKSRRHEVRAVIRRCELHYVWFNKSFGVRAAQTAAVINIYNTDLPEVAVFDVRGVSLASVDRSRGQRACEPPKSRCSLPPMDICNTRRVTSTLTVSWVEIRYLMEEGVG
ncbi:hypothetical protein EVAR_53067_1 [Eumeta japonica]|uniref:Uncharacterized protein n=1 Tax=Eumeta variegata TaxID=151549 RepID=A0A4C1YRT9_EUMVA|nr:hypothetical protein EVAR_53067_1 [Eumeta japonica]